MKCPYCNHDMESGELRSSGKIMWLPSGLSAPFPPTQNNVRRKGGVLLPCKMGAIYGHFPTKSYFCRNCNRILLDL